MVDVSVIIPTWNRAGTIEKAARSVLNQTNSSVEVLVCDDGSTDNTFEVIQSIHDPRVRWIAGRRGGRPAIPRNYGIRESRGEWIAFLDSDDEWLPEKVEKQIFHAKKLDCLAVCSNAYRVIPGQGISGHLLTCSRNRITFDNMLLSNDVICSSMVVNKRLFEIIDGFPEDPRLRAIEDYALWLRVATQTDIACVCEPLVMYTDDPVNSIRKEYSSTYLQRKAIMADFRRWCKACRIDNSYLYKARKRQTEFSLRYYKYSFLNAAAKFKNNFCK